MNLIVDKFQQFIDTYIIQTTDMLHAIKWNLKDNLDDIILY